MAQEQLDQKLDQTRLKELLEASRKEIAALRPREGGGAATVVAAETAAAGTVSPTGTVEARTSRATTDTEKEAGQDRIDRAAGTAGDRRAAVQDEDKGENEAGRRVGKEERQGDEQWQVRAWLIRVGDEDPERAAVEELRKQIAPDRQLAMEYLLRINPRLLAETIKDNLYLEVDAIDLAGLAWSELTQAQQDALEEALSTEGVMYAGQYEADLANLRQLLGREKLTVDEQRKKQMISVRLILSRKPGLVQLGKKVVAG